jgi:F0F1-type ATP synthase epsilon subunit
MLFLLATPEYNNVQANTTRVKVHLRNGVAEIYEQHQDLMGKVENNLVEIETNFENKLEKFSFVLQDAVFIVSNKGLDEESENQETGVYVYAKKVQELGPNLSIDKLTEEYTQKKEELDKELEKLNNKSSDPLDSVINSKVLLLQEDVEFLRRTLVIVKESKS